MFNAKNNILLCFVFESSPMSKFYSETVILIICISFESLIVLSMDIYAGCEYGCSLWLTFDLPPLDEFKGQNLLAVILSIISSNIYTIVT